MSKETLIVIIETLECEGHILKSTESVNKQTIQLNVSTKTYHIYLNILSEKLGGRGDHLTITHILNMFCSSISVRTEACEEGLSQMQAYLMFR